MNTHSTDLKREHTQADARPEKPKITPKTFCKPALHGLLTTSMNAKDHRNAKLGLESPIAGNISALNAPGSTTHSNGNNIVVSRSLLRSTNVSDTVKGTPKDDNRPIFELKRSRIIKVDTISPKPDLPLEKELMEVSGKKGFHVATSRIANSYAEEKPALRSPSKMQKIPKESVSDQKGPTVLKRIVASSPARKSPKTVSELGNKTIPRSGIPKARMDNAISSAISCEMGEISELELPALLENDGNVEKAEACRKELEDICISLKRKHAEAKELAVRAIVNNNMMLMLNHPMFEEKICALQKFAKSLRSKKFLFEDISAMDAH